MARVLIVDDEPSMVEALGLYLKLAGHEALPALSGEEAIQRVIADPPQLILLTIHMSSTDGLEVLRRIRLINEDVKVIVIAAVRNEQLRHDALARGAADFITKPIDLKYLGRSISTLLGPMLM